MTKIKICGLRSQRDVEIINRYKPDYAGFIVDFPKSFRSLTLNELEALTSHLDSTIPSVGVFVDEDVHVVCDLLERGVITIAQLHGKETEDYIQDVKRFGPVIKAFTIRTNEDIEQALQSSADYILLDQGKGSGQTFDWSLVPEISRPYFLAGGLDELNISNAISQLHPWGIDLSSGVETNKIKDEEKIKRCIEISRGG